MCRDKRVHTLVELVVHEVGPTLGPCSILTPFTKLCFDSRTKLQQLGFSRNALYRISYADWANVSHRTALHIPRAVLVKGNSSI